MESRGSKSTNRKLEKADLDFGAGVQTAHDSMPWITGRTGVNAKWTLGHSDTNAAEKPAITRTNPAYFAPTLGKSDRHTPGRLPKAWVGPQGFEPGTNGL